MIIREIMSKAMLPAGRNFLSSIPRTNANHAKTFGVQCQRLSTICAARLPGGVKSRGCLDGLNGLNGAAGYGLRNAAQRNVGLKSEEIAGRRGYKTVQEQRSRYKSGVCGLSSLLSLLLLWRFCGASVYFLYAQYMIGNAKG